MAMKETVTRVKTYITSLVERLRLDGGLWVWSLVSYWPLIAALAAGLPLIFLPAMFDLAGWVYVFTVPLGVVGGLLAYIGAYMMLGD